MKKLMFAAIGMTGILASCGSSGSAPDGSGSARIVDLRTEYATSLTPTAQYAGCDVITNPSDPSRKYSTQVVVEFAAAGSINSVDVRLKGTNTNTYDNNFNKNVPASSLKKLANGNYRVTFDANSATGAFLPNNLNSQGIEVTPVDQDPLPVKAVTGQNKVDGGFYTELTVNTDTASFTINSRFLRVIPVYRSCTLQTANPLSL
ncbi:hypothetical protein [Deinococcus aerophilus]|uniref:Lipoprotein n=1 Tax=Deinococcus aerophilus TaxID=522488 RepID=A0ABQ2GQ95_9DEIO|nr:hypothetical protein [Deinococcus aerophilus]GGM06033.1 hypothetical protein GCM10010841_12940 [Deinococcus aerophilus]